MRQDYRIINARTIATTLIDDDFDLHNTSNLFRKVYLKNRVFSLQGPGGDDALAGYVLSDEYIGRYIGYSTVRGVEAACVEIRKDYF